MPIHLFGRNSTILGSERKRGARSLSMEQLEDRTVPSTFTVVNLQDGGNGSLRQAILDANGNPGADLIEFNLAGTIRLTTGALPAIAGQVDIDGTTAPGFAGTPVIEVDYNHFGGLQFNLGSAGSALRSLGLINAAGAGVAFNGAGDMLVVGNYIGLKLDGITVAGNGGDGLELNLSSGNTIGQSDPVTSVTYANADNFPMQPVSGWQGIRGSDTSGNFLIAGTSGANGLLFDGAIDGDGTSYAVNYPGAANTSVYGPDNLHGAGIRLVGSYKNADASTAAVKVNGFLFGGTTADLSNSANYQTIDYLGAEFNYVHSTMVGLAVGNYDSAFEQGTVDLPLGPGHAYLFDIAAETFLTDIVYPGSLSNTAYGIWYNGGTSYTICGGWSPALANNFDDQNRPIGLGYLVDYDSQTGVFTNWTSFDYPNGINFVTHFEGISSVEKGVYTLSADSVQIGSANPAQGSFASVRRNTDGSFGDADWVDLNYTGVDPTTNITSSNAVFGNQVVGIVIGANPFSYQATVNVGFQLSNVISGNGGNGIGLYGANDNVIAMNYIGTDATGTLDLGNAGNGILLTNGAARNTIGGQATGGNDPTSDVFVRPPRGNLISGNDASGVLIDGAATLNLLSGNYIGTDASGISPLGNTLDGLAIENADGNQLIGCTFQQNPFVFYNVLGGNGGNGLRITDSNDTTVQANFFGMGADNTTGVGNALDGMLIEGSSANTQFGGVIPLGNVVVANGRNGVEIAGTSSGTVVFNTFAGLPAFKTIAVPNLLDGILITSTGGNNLIRTNVIAGNGANGVHISGAATGVQVTETIIGMNTNGSAPIPNGANGVLIDGSAHENLIGGEQVSVILQNTISANGANGVAIVGNALNNRVFHSFIGTEIKGLQAFGNAAAGIFVGGNARGTVIGGTGSFENNVISGNLGDGIHLSSGSQGTQIIGNLIGTDRNGEQPLGNLGSGIWTASSANQIGGAAAGEGNAIANNLYGVLVDTGVSNAIRGNSIFSNSVSGISLVADGNLSQPAPILTGAYQPTDTTIQVSGILAAAANTSYIIEIFASPTNTPPDQGKTIFGSMTIFTGANGIASFVLSAAFSTSAGAFFTATASSPANNTSAFSAPIALGGNANTLFVASAYGLLLGRVPDPSASGWVNALNGGVSPASVVLGIESSTEYLKIQVTALYVHYLDRNPEPAGEQYWLHVLQTGGTLEQAAEGIVSSDEYFQDHGGANQGYVLGLYDQVLGRVPSDAELHGWITFLNAGASRMTVAVGFLASTEYHTNLVEADYKTYLGRPADPAGLATWLSNFQAGATDQEVLAAILGSPEGVAKWS